MSNQQFKSLLQTKFKLNNSDATSLNTSIYNYATKGGNENKSEIECEKDYKAIIYNLLSIKENTNTTKKNNKNVKVDINKLICKIKNGEFDWNHEIFQTIKRDIEEQDSFMTNPFEVVEGVLTCNKCSCTKIFYYTKQTRKADEPASTFATCTKCGNKWVYSG